MPGSSTAVDTRPHFPRMALDGVGEQIGQRPGSTPRWSQDGRRIFYQNDRGQVVAAEVRTFPTIMVGRESVLCFSL